MRCDYCQKTLLERDRIFVSGKCIHRKCLVKFSRFEVKKRKLAKAEREQQRLIRWAF